MHYRVALKTGLPISYARRMMCEGVLELIQWVAKATRRVMAQNQQALKTGSGFSLVPQCMGPTTQFNDA